MRKQILCALTFVFCCGALANVAAPPASVVPNYRANWIETKSVQTSTDGAEVRVQWRQRNVEVLGKPIQVATITCGEIKDPGGRLIPKDLPAAIAKISKIKKWKQETRGAYTAYEAALPDQAQYLKVFVYKNKDTYRYSIATMRVAFMLPTYFEVEMIQREQIGDVQGVAALKSSGNKFAWLFRGAVPTANAIDLSGIANYLNGWLSAGQSAAQGIQQAPGAINNAASAINNGASSIDNLSATARTSSAELSGAADRFGNRLGDFNDTVNKFQDRGNIAKTAAIAGLAGGLGGAAGAAMFHFGAQGAAYGAREIYYLITGDLKPEIRQRMGTSGQLAWDSIDALSAEVINMTTQMDLEQHALKMASGVDPMTADRAKAQIRVLESDLRKLSHRLDNDPNNAERMKCAEQMGPIEDKLSELKKVLPILEAQKNGNDVCSSFARKYERWVAIESELQEARNAILNNTFVIVAKANREIQDSARSLSSAREESKECNYGSSIRKAFKFVESENGCNCGTQARTERCVSACSSLENFQRAQMACNDTAAANKNLDPLEELQRESAIMRNNSESFFRRQAQVADPAGYGKLQSNLTMQFANVLEKCGNAPKVVLPIDVQKGQAKFAAASERPLASYNQGQLPTPKESGGFLNMLISPFQKMFKAVTGG